MIIGRRYSLSKGMLFKRSKSKDLYQVMDDLRVWNITKSEFVEVDDEECVFVQTMQEVMCSLHEWIPEEAKNLHKWNELGITI